MEKSNMNGDEGTKTVDDGVKACNSSEKFGGEERNPNLHQPVKYSREEEEEGTMSAVLPSGQSCRTPFTHLSQIDADLALARTLQEQERAYMMLRMTGEESDYGSWESGSFVLENDDDNDLGDPDADSDSDENNSTYEDNDNEDAFDAFSHSNNTEDYNPNDELDPSAFSSDEAYARALQDAEGREMAARMLALTGISDREPRNLVSFGVNSQNAWEEVDPDELSYEELIALGEVVGTESRGLSADKIARLPSMTYHTENSQNGKHDSCVICRVDYEDGESLNLLHCGHLYHPDCLSNWLQRNKRCPVCIAEVCPSSDQ